jgi:predicted metal-dependent enzyme (double-stranded beta helix superfamily)
MPAFTDLRTDYLAIARRFADHPGDWPLAPRFDPNKRWYHRIAHAQQAEVWLLSWLPGQATDLHDHGGSAGAFVVVSGTLIEYTLTDDTDYTEQPDPAGGARLRPTSLPTGAGRRFDARHIHLLGNEGDRPAVSVHVYGPGLTSMTRYRVEGGRLRVTAVDRAGVQW